MSIKKEIVRNLREFRRFVFIIPARKGDRNAWKFVLALWGSIFLFWTCVVVLTIVNSVIHAF